MLAHLSKLMKKKDMKTNGNRWIITKKEKYDGQKTLYKVRLATRVFKEEIKPQSDCPTISRENFKLKVALSANEGFKLISMDIHTAFLKAKIMDRDVLMVHPADIRKQGKVKRLL